MDDDDSALKSIIIGNLREILDQCNPYVQTYRAIRNTIVQQPGHSNLKLRILGKRGRDGRRYNLPFALEVVALIVGDYGSADFERDLIVVTQSGLLQRVSLYEPAYLPLQYPLLFPRGEDGFRKDIPFNDELNPNSTKREFICKRSGLLTESNREALISQPFYFQRGYANNFWWIRLAFLSHRACSI